MGTDLSRKAAASSGEKKGENLESGWTLIGGSRNQMYSEVNVIAAIISLTYYSSRLGYCCFDCNSSLSFFGREKMSYNGCSSIDKAGKILCIHSYTNLNRSRRHLYRDDSCDYSIRYVYSYLENFRYPSTSHRPSICCHCRRRTEQFLEHC